MGSLKKMPPVISSATPLLHPPVQFIFLFSTLVKTSAQPWDYLSCPDIVILQIEEEIRQDPK